MVCEDTLKFRNFPESFSKSDKEDFLRHFGAEEIKIIESKIKRKCVAYAKFPSKQKAQSLVRRLHQIKVFDSLLYVEYAQHDPTTTNLPQIKEESDDLKSKKHYKNFITRLNAFNSSVNFNQPPPNHLKYAYPKPNAGTINNIAHALASIPKFYTQVLHLMNKMNLPPPFSNVAEPPCEASRVSLASEASRVSLGSEASRVSVASEPSHVSVSESLHASESQPSRVQIPDEVATVPREESSESELESDPESDKNKEVIPLKRNLKQKKVMKRPKFIKPNVVTTNSNVQQDVGDVFEKVEIQQGKIEINVSVECLENKTNVTSEETAVTNEESASKVDPVESTINSSKEGNNKGEPIQQNECISEEELSANRIPLKDLSVLPVFKDYHPGVPSTRLYIKNIAKTVEKSDLEFIYRRFVKKKGDGEDEVFNVRLMQEGRMKGQAFVTLESIDVAQTALKETNGYILKDKPLVVVFGRSAVNKK